MGEGLGFLSIPVHGLGDTRPDVVAETWLSPASQDTARAPHARQPTAWVTAPPRPAPPHRAPRCLHHHGGARRGGGGGWGVGCLALRRPLSGLCSKWPFQSQPVNVPRRLQRRRLRPAGEAEEGTSRPQPRLGINFPR